MSCKRVGSFYNFFFSFEKLGMIWGQASLCCTWVMDTFIYISTMNLLFEKQQKREKMQVT